jgi:hypothetical protein
MSSIFDKIRRIPQAIFRNMIAQWTDVRTAVPIVCMMCFDIYTLFFMPIPIIYRVCIFTAVFICTTWIKRDEFMSAFRGESI